MFKDCIYYLCSCFCSCFDDSEFEKSKNKIIDLVNTEQYNKALSLILSQPHYSKEPEFIYFKIYSLNRLEKYEEALLYAEEEIEKNPNNFNALKEKAFAIRMSEDHKRY
ncbi:hypothetical protein OAP56_02370 [Rickettsiaceae bacterium]|nr:hypothetical protein [Rickettsiaceae bacterium]